MATLLALGLTFPVSPADGLRAKSAGRFVVREKFDPSQGIAIEGYVSYLVVRRAASGDVVLRQSETAPLRMDSVLPRGSYRLRTFIRICDGNCGLLDPPSNRCSGSFRLAAGDVVKARISRDATGCRVSIDP